MTSTRHDHGPVQDAAAPSNAKMPPALTYRSMRWDDLDAVVDLFDRTWGQTGDIAKSRYAKLISRYFILHYAQPTTFANVAMTSDGVLAGVTFARVVGQPVCLPQATEEMARVVEELESDETAARRLQAVNHMYATELVLERESAANETTQGELELFVVNPDIRGCGVGGSLWRQLHEHFASRHVADFYLHTDSSCDVSFYDAHGMTRIAQRLCAEVSDLSDEDRAVFEDMFIYRGEVVRA